MRIIGDEPKNRTRFGANVFLPRGGSVDFDNLHLIFGTKQSYVSLTRRRHRPAGLTYADLIGSRKGQNARAHVRMPFIAKIDLSVFILTNTVSYQ